jgi:hypothetical protein
MAGKVNINSTANSTSAAQGNKPANLWGKQLRAYAEGYNFVKGGGNYLQAYPNATYGGDVNNPTSAAWAWKQGCADRNAGKAAAHV